MSKTSRKLPPLHLPALRCKMGDRGYMVASMKFREISERIKGIPEVHSSKKLREWIQRQLDEKHAAEIGEYLKTEEARFFNALVVGVYGGDPQWSALKLSDPRNELAEEEEEQLAESIGILTLSGEEKLFPIDGQHRVAGIKQAVRDKPSLADDQVSVVMVGHGNTEEGMKRTRRLFVTLNQRAKRVSDRDIVALDEDNGLAIVTRDMIDDYELFQEEGVMSFSGSVSILENDDSAVTSVLGLFQIVKALYPRRHASWPKFSAVQRSRPSTPTLKSIYEYYTGYWKILIETIPEYKVALEDGTKTCGHYRRPVKNHLLFRPVGQLAFARATQFLMSRKKTMKEAVEELHEANSMWLNEHIWHNILWDPVRKRMLNNWSIAETALLTAAGSPARSPAAMKKLKAIRKANPVE